MTNQYYLQLFVPEDWSTSDKGAFFEQFITEILRPMRLRVVQQLRVTGMEIDLLAESLDEPRQILVECKAFRDPLPADTITKLIGNVEVRKAKAGWLFTTCDLTKDGKGLWHEIQNDTQLAQKFVWYKPKTIIDILIDQKSIVAFSTLEHNFQPTSIGDWTLIIVPSAWVWLVQLIENGIPTRYSAFNARTGAPLNEEDSNGIAQLEPRFASLECSVIGTTRDVEHKQVGSSKNISSRAIVAKVIPGDAWDDLRPARPTDFVGRDDAIAELIEFIDQVHQGNTATRNWAIQGPSGWGKSSLILKLADLAGRGKLHNCSITAIDTRSATNSAFVSESIRVAFEEAKARGIIPDLEYRVAGLGHPLGADDFRRALNDLAQTKSLIILVFDQFEELFAKEELFETFNAVRELCLDVDANTLPFLLGFAWKIDISLPQEHPAYYLWHQLNDRRKSFKIRQFGKSDILKIITKAEKSVGKKLTPALRVRLVEQCQGFPWLLKKLLVHIFRQVTSTESQYLLLERELDVEKLFKDDLAELKEEQVRCLKFVALKAPIAVSEVEANFTRDATNALIESHLLVRSGMNYAIYWDIFKDYLIDERVPQIPWARTFQSSPLAAIKTLQKLGDVGPTDPSTLAAALQIKEGACFNILSDLNALQLVDRLPNDLYTRATHLKDLQPISIAEHTQGQLRRHLMLIELYELLDRGQKLSPTEWDSFFSRIYPRATDYSQKTVHTYAANMRRWLVFSGLMEISGRYTIRPVDVGKQLGALTSIGSKKYRNPSGRQFIGATTPKKLIRLIEILGKDLAGLDRKKLESQGFRNAVQDALALELATISGADNKIQLSSRISSQAQFEQYAKGIVQQQPGIQILELGAQKGLSSTEIQTNLKQSLGPHWQLSSVRRIANGLRVYLDWTKSIE